MITCFISHVQLNHFLPNNETSSPNLGYSLSYVDGDVPTCGDVGCGIGGLFIPLFFGLLFNVADDKEDVVELFCGVPLPITPFIIVDVLGSNFIGVF